MYLYLRKYGTYKHAGCCSARFVWPSKFRSLAHPQTRHRSSHMQTRFLLKLPVRATYLPETNLYIGLSPRVESSNGDLFRVVNTEVQFFAIISVLQHVIRKNYPLRSRPSIQDDTISLEVSFRCSHVELCELQAIACCICHGNTAGM